MLIRASFVFSPGVTFWDLGEQTGVFFLSNRGNWKPTLGPYIRFLIIKFNSTASAPAAV